MNNKTTEELKTELDLLLSQSTSKEQKELIGKYRIEYANKASVLLDEYMEKEIEVLKNSALKLKE